MKYNDYLSALGYKEDESIDSWQGAIHEAEDEISFLQTIIGCLKPRPRNLPSDFRGDFNKAFRFTCAGDYDKAFNIILKDNALSLYLMEHNSTHLAMELMLYSDHNDLSLLLWEEAAIREEEYAVNTKDNQYAKLANEVLDDDIQKSDSSKKDVYIRVKKRLGDCLRYYGQDKEAFVCYKSLADKGDSDAMNKLGCMYWCGRGVSANRDEAIRLFKEAANKGSIAAKHNLRGREGLFNKIVLSMSKESNRKSNQFLEW